MKQRTALGVWSDVRTGTAGVVGWFSWMVVFAGSLFVAERGVNGVGTPTVVQIHSFDGTTWAVDVDVLATWGGPTVFITPGTPVIVADTLLAWPFGITGQGFIATRTTGGVWAQALASVADVALINAVGAVMPTGAG